jgi:tetratricopeptide (TPR) repeat protein
MKLQEFQHLLNEMSEDVFEATVDQLVFNSKGILSTQQVREELHALLGDGTLSRRIMRGTRLIVDDLRGHLSKVEFGKFQEECDHAIGKIAELSQQKGSFSDEMLDKLEEIPDSLYQFLGFSDQTVEWCYQAGLRQYGATHYKEAAEIFLTLSVLCPMKANVWLSLGLSEKQWFHYPEALEAFGMAAIMDGQSPLPLIYSAECYLDSNDSAKAEGLLQCALERIKKHPSANSRQYTDYINHLLRKG